MPVLSPAETVTRPPEYTSPRPTAMLTLPAAPSTAVPLRTMTFPLLPFVLVPVANERLPLALPAPESALRTLNAPLEVMLPY